MSGINQPDRNAVGNVSGLTIRHRNKERGKRLDIRGHIDRLDRLFAGPEQPARVLLGVGLLDFRRVMQNELREVDRRGRRVDFALITAGRQERQPARVGQDVRA